MESSCIAVDFVFVGQHLVVKFPGTQRVGLGNLLNRIAHMNHYMIARARRLIYKKEQTDGTFNSFSLAARHEAVTLPRPA